MGISNRHVHLSSEHLQTLFGAGYQLTPLKDLSQPGQYAAKETIMLAGPKGSIDQVRILGPCRSVTQVEILASDCYKLGVKAKLGVSGQLQSSAGNLTLVGPKGSVHLCQGVIIAQRHIHMSLADAERLGVSDGQSVSITIPGERGGVFHNTLIRADNNSALELHLDTEEANALGVTAQTLIRLTA